VRNADQDTALAERLDRLHVPELSEDFYRELRASLADEPRGPRFSIRSLPWLRTGWGVRLAAAVALIALAAGGVVEVVDRLGGTPSPALISDRAYAAVSEHEGILHYVVASWSFPESMYSYSEYWASLSDAPRYRAVQTAGNGRLFGQIEYNGAMIAARYDESGNRIVQPVPTGPVVEGESPGKVPQPREAASAPLESYRDLTRAGTVKSAEEITIYDQPAYRVVVEVDGPGPGRKTTTTYVVNRDTYLPIEYTVRTATPVPGLSVTTYERFLQFEVLPANGDNEELLDWDATPEPFHPEQPPARPSGGN
jgi:hypothetical protein